MIYPFALIEEAGIVVDGADGSEDVYAYTAWTGSTFTLSGTTSEEYTNAGGDTVYVPYVYEESTGTSVTVTVIYVSDRSIIMRFRKKGYLPFETTDTFGSSGYSVAAIKTVDSIVA